MYKLTFYDECCSPIFDGVVYYFVDDLNQFEKDWIMENSSDNTLIEKYFLSKNGQKIADSYFDNEKFNIVQEDKNSKILTSKNIEFKNKEITLFNTYDYPIQVLFPLLNIELCVILYENRYYLCGKYKGFGGVRINPEGFYNRWIDRNVKYHQLWFFGNKIAHYKQRNVDWDKIRKDDAYKDFLTDNLDFYSKEELKSFVWIPIVEVDKDYKISDISDEELAYLLRDIVGESG